MEDYAFPWMQFIRVTAAKNKSADPDPDVVLCTAFENINGSPLDPDRFLETGRNGKFCNGEYALEINEEATIAARKDER